MKWCPKEGKILNPKEKEKEKQELLARESEPAKSCCDLPSLIQKIKQKNSKEKRDTERMVRIKDKKDK